MTSYHIWYINLDTRNDRRSSIESQLRATGLLPHATRFSAISHEKGYIGCAASHVACLKAALESNVEFAVIMEDDAAWRISLLEAKTRLESACSESFDVMVLGSSTYGFKSQPIPGSQYKRALAAQTTTAYIVRRAYIPTLLACFEKAHQNLLLGARESDAVIDVAWKTLQAKDMWLIPVPSWVVQESSYSDIRKANVSYPFV